MPDELENRSVRYFSTSKPLACAVEITEYKMALHFAPLAVLLKSQFLRPTVNGLIAFSALLLSIGTSPSSRNVYRYFFSLSVYLTASTSLFLPLLTCVSKLCDSVSHSFQLCMELLFSGSNVIRLNDRSCIRNEL